MVGDLPAGVGEGPSVHPPVGSRPPSYPWQPARRARPWLAIALAVTAAVAAGAPAIALIRPATRLAVATTLPKYTLSETAAAQKHLCDTYRLVAQAVATDTNANDRALARIADTNGALLLNMPADNLALDADRRDAAKAWAAAYGAVTANNNSAAASDADYQAALDDVIAKDIAMKKVCGGA
ncbi:hypothetical protein [Mycobacterium avium]|uniref:hypothetical protein n=1 Tax=Mycobacterium avium TaxID=1764 RepID=UPI0003D20D4C|nr:hypothetical protein [Mycobacterium avium]AYJ07421.1 hypothetical protein DBO90_23280 [Mycobacterium avium]ETB03310.1 hypothetical protein P863_23255 [Mycobacterium avium subsp. silvaticum ATCC 49884]ETB09798.1 hypothetical protein O972_25140 [Mycobacterium avium subsp. avium 10-9275]ETB16588.1 hypothetical protein O973_23940 [Mycobacterium avium subsp. avium 11-4751]